jgi:hypothetical protein
MNPDDQYKNLNLYKVLTEDDDIGHALSHHYYECQDIHTLAGSVHLDRGSSNREPNHSESVISFGAQ